MPEIFNGRPFGCKGGTYLNDVGRGDDDDDDNDDDDDEEEEEEGRG